MTPSVRAVSALMLLLFVCSFTLFGAVPARAFEFAADTGVTELTPATLPGFLRSHKPVVVLFYAPWCGHCKHFRPEYIRFAQAMKGTVRVGALNADEHKSVAQQYGIQGFPTVKFWRMPSATSKTRSAEDYQGGRTASALQGFIAGTIKHDRVRVVHSAAELQEAGTVDQTAAVLFSAKDRVPPMFAVLSYSPRLRGMGFVLAARGAHNDLAARYGVSKFPTILVLRRDEQGGMSAAGAPYAGKIAYEPLAKYLLDFADGTADRASDAAAADSTTPPQQSQQDNDKAAADARRDEEGKAARRSSAALPLAPQPLDEHTIERYCTPSASRLRGQVPLCVLSLSPDVDLQLVHTAFAHEPVLFFDAAGQVVSLTQQLQAITTLSLGELAPQKGAAEEEEGGNDDDSSSGGGGRGGVAATDAAMLTDAVLLLRYAKTGTIRYHLLRNVRATSVLHDALQRVFNGELRLSTKRLSAA